MPQLAVD